ncbi:mitochondrial triosephosphate isomerase [Xylariaceae sp. FL1019]|nr:mitochondrial triosephosphate isomerase [Xylariaceae sp. FL1019]
MSSLPPRRRLVGVSTKMYFTFSRTLSYTQSLLSSLSRLSPSTLSTLAEIDIFIIPDHISLVTVQSLLTTSPLPILLGAQDAHSADLGAYTGEVSPAVLSEVGCRILELGHAERRRLFGETDESASLKAAAAARNGMVPLICVGEKTKPSPSSPLTTGSGGEEDLDINTSLPEILTQVNTVLAAVPPDADVILAYEPVWAIGAAAPASASYVVGVTQAMRQFESVTQRSGTTRILYGGSAGPGLFEKLKDGVDGLFLGRFAHDVESFVRTICEVATA